VDTRRK